MEKRVWFITGANRGLGRAFAEESAKNGDCVVCCARRADDSDPFYKKENVLLVRADVTDKEQVKNAVHEAAAHFGRIDILVNNAGFGLNGALEEISIDELRVLFETDYFGLVQVTQAVLPFMRKQGSGRILNVSSQAGVVAGAGCTAYNAVKFAVVGLSQGLAQELAPFGIQVAAVCPGPFRTDFRDPSSAKRPLHPMPEYDGTPAHDLVNYLDENNHMQDGDPEKAAAFIYRQATAEKLPGLIAIGRGCCDSIRETYAKTLAEMDGYYEDSAMTAFR